MKRHHLLIFKLFSFCIASAALLLTVGCTPDSYDSPSADGLPVAANYANNVSITVDPQERYAYLRFSAAPGITPVWLVDGTIYSSDFTFKKFYDHAGTHTVEFRVKNANGISADAVTRQFDMVIAEPQWVDVDGADNLWNVSTPTYSWRYLDDDMSTARTAPAVTQSGRAYTFTLPQATTFRQQAMVTFATQMTIEDETQEYDMIALIESSESFTAGVKAFDRTDANNYLFDETVDLKAGETTRFFVRQATATSPISGGSGRTAKRVSLRFDFGTNPANTTITIKDIIFQKHITNQ